MNGKTIGFINEKGGVGKSSCCFNLGWELSNNKKVLMIDLDGQQANLTYFCGIEKTDNLKTMMDVLDQEEKVENVILNVKKNLDLIPADVSIAQLGTRQHIMKYANKYGTEWVKQNYNEEMFSNMTDALDILKKKYDYIFVDVNPTPNFAHLLCLCGIDYVTVVMLPDAASLEGDKGTEESIRNVIEYEVNPNIKVLGILFNRNTNRTNLAKEVKKAAEVYAERLNTKVFESSIRQSVVMGECVAAHKGITEYAPKSMASADIKMVVKEMEGRLENA